jgi:hypothetical protein
MKLIALEYVGRKPYKDSTSLRNDWLTGDVKRVPEMDAQILLRSFVEFKKSDKVAADIEADVHAVIASNKKRDDDEERLKEGMLLTIMNMDKDSLEAYAELYAVKLDKRRKVGDLQMEVSNLVEQFGVR